MTLSTVYEKHGLTGELIFENALSRLMNGLATIDEALDYIMEFARGHWSLVVDENLESLAHELALLNYGVIAIPKGTQDREIRDKFASRGVFITSDASDFDLSLVPQPFDEGMIVVPNGVDARRLARAMEKVLMGWRKNHGAKPVKVKLRRSDV